MASAWGPAGLPHPGMRQFEPNGCHLSHSAALEFRREKRREPGAVALRPGRADVNNVRSAAKLSG